MKRKSNRCGVLIAFTLCVLAVGVGTFTAVRGDKAREKTPAAEKADEAFTFHVEPSAEPAPANEPVSGVPDTRGPVYYSPGEGFGETESEEAAADKPVRVLPLGTKIIKDYSGGELVRSATMEDWRAHNGIDFGGEPGAAVCSAADGVVSSVFKDDFWGNVVEISLNDSVTARYCGLGSISVKAGDSISAGDSFAVLGEIPAESADGPHLHFEIIADGNFADPLEYLNIPDPAE